jgi:hypothetical protein
MKTMGQRWGFIIAMVLLLWLVLWEVWRGVSCGW